MTAYWLPFWILTAVFALVGSASLGELGFVAGAIVGSYVGLLVTSIRGWLFVRRVRKAGPAPFQPATDGRTAADSTAPRAARRGPFVIGFLLAGAAGLVVGTLGTYLFTYQDDLIGLGGVVGFLVATGMFVIWRQMARPAPPEATPVAPIGTAAPGSSHPPGRPVEAWLAGAPAASSGVAIEAKVFRSVVVTENGVVSEQVSVFERETMRPEPASPAAEVSPASELETAGPGSDSGEDLRPPQMGELDGASRAARQDPLSDSQPVVGPGTERFFGDAVPPSGGVQVEPLPSKEERILQAHAPWHQALRPLLYENFLLFVLSIGAFLILAGASFTIVDNWNRAGEWRPVWAAGLTALYTHIFLGLGYVLARKSALYSVSLAILSIGVLLLPFQYLGVGLVTATFPMLGVMAALLLAAVDYPALVVTGSLHHRASGRRFAIAYLATSLLHVPLAAMGSAAGAAAPWAASILFLPLYFGALRPFVRLYLPTILIDSVRSAVFYLGALLFAFLVLIGHLHFLVADAGNPIPPAAYRGPLLVLFAAIFLDVHRSLRDHPEKARHLELWRGLGLALAVGGVMLALGSWLEGSEARSALPIAAALSMFLFARAELEDSRPVHLYGALVFSLIAYDTSPALFSELARALLKGVATAAGYGDRPLPLSYYSLTFLPYLVGIGWLASWMDRRGKRPWPYVGWATCVGVIALGLSLSDLDDLRPALAATLVYGALAFVVYRRWGLRGYLAAALLAVPLAAGLAPAVLGEAVDQSVLAAAIGTLALSTGGWLLRSSVEGAVFSYAAGLAAVGVLALAVPALADGHSLTLALVILPVAAGLATAGCPCRAYAYTTCVAMLFLAFRLTELVLPRWHEGGFAVILPAALVYVLGLAADLFMARRNRIAFQSAPPPRQEEGNDPRAASIHRLDPATDPHAQGWPGPGVEWGSEGLPRKTEWFPRLPPRAPSQPAPAFLDAFAAAIADPALRSAWLLAVLVGVWSTIELEAPREWASPCLAISGLLLLFITARRPHPFHALLGWVALALAAYGGAIEGLPVDRACLGLVGIAGALTILALLFHFELWPRNQTTRWKPETYAQPARWVAVGTLLVAGMISFEHFDPLDLIFPSWSGQIGYRVLAAIGACALLLVHVRMNGVGLLAFLAGVAGLWGISKGFRITLGSPGGGVGFGDGGIGTLPFRTEMRFVLNLLALSVGQITILAMTGPRSAVWIPGRLAGRDQVNKVVKSWSAVVLISGLVIAGGLGLTAVYGAYGWLRDWLDWTVSGVGVTDWRYERVFWLQWVLVSVLTLRCLGIAGQRLKNPLAIPGVVAAGMMAFVTAGAALGWRVDWIGLAVAVGATLAWDLAMPGSWLWDDARWAHRIAERSRWSGPLAEIACIGALIWGSTLGDLDPRRLSSVLIVLTATVAVLALAVRRMWQWLLPVVVAGTYVAVCYLLVWYGLNFPTGRPEEAILPFFGLAAMGLSELVQLVRARAGSTREVAVQPQSRRARIYSLLRNSRRELRWSAAGLRVLAVGLAILTALALADRASSLETLACALTLSGLAASWFARGWMEGRESLVQRAFFAAMGALMYVRWFGPWFRDLSPAVDTAFWIAGGFTLLGLWKLRAGPDVVHRPLLTWALLCPLGMAPWLFWAKNLQIGSGLVAVGILYVAAAWETGKARLSVLASIVLNVGLLVIFSEKGLEHSSFYGLPIGATLLVLVQSERDRLSRNARFWLQNIAVAIICGSAAYESLIVGGIGSFLLLLGLCLLGIFAGMLLRTRSFVMCATAILIATVIGQLWRATQELALSKAIVLMSLGTALVAVTLFASFKRQQILSWYRLVMEDFTRWD